MNILLSGLSLFVLAFAIHWLVWRVRLPRRQSHALLLIFLGTFAGALLFRFLFPRDGVWLFPLPQDGVGTLHVFLLFISLTLSYLITYSALEADSPSLVIVKRIAQSQPAGLAPQELAQELPDEVLILPRLRDLLRDNLVAPHGEKLQLTAQGRIFIQVFIIFRGLIKAGKGG